MSIFVSSTFQDLAEHRAAVNEVLLRMRQRLSAMEYFGSRADEAVPVCTQEIAQCQVFIGIYAWRYGWQPQAEGPSITELEFRLARSQKKKCLCYLVDEHHPWPPLSIDTGDAADRLNRFKQEVSRLVRSKFTTPDNLAKQIAADLARELAPDLPRTSFGGLLQVSWTVFSLEMQEVLSTAYSVARVESDDGVVATRHFVTALKGIPNTARSLLESFGHVPIQPLLPNLPYPTVDELFSYEKPISSCVLASMNRLLPAHSPTQRLLAIELAVDLIKHGTGSSVADFRHAGVDSAAVDKTFAHIQRISSDHRLLRDALRTLDDAQVLHIAYLADITLPQDLTAEALREKVLFNAQHENRLLLLVGELMRRQPKLVTL